VAADQTAANSMANALTVHKINAELGKNGLPQAEILDPPQVKQIVKEESNKTPIIVAAVVSSVVILFAVGACVFIRRRRTATKKADTHVWTDVAGAETLPSPQAARASAPPVPTTTTSSERRTESPSPPIELDQVMMGYNIELDQVMMDVALTRARPTMTAVTPVQLPEINPIDFSKPPEEVKSKIAKRIKEVMSKANFTLSADTGFINTVPMEGVAQLMVAAEVTPARTSKVIPEAGVDSSGEISTSGRSLQDQVMMDVALTPARPTMTAVTPVQLPEINPVDFSKPPEEVKSKIAKRIKEVMSKENVTLSADSGFNTIPMEGVAELMVAAEVAPARTSKVIPEAGVDSSGQISESGRSLQDLSREISTSTRKTPAPQETYTSSLFKENNLAYVNLQSPSSGQTLAPVARMAQASLGSDPANKICSRDRLKAMFPAAEDDIESSEDEKDSAAVHG
jgi:hypothetical protein